MLRKRPTQETDGWDVDAGAGAGDGAGDGASAPNRKTARYVAAVAVAGLAAATIGLVPAFAGAGAPELPKVSAEELIAKIAESDVQQLSGTVKVATDLGLPSLPELGSSGGSGGGSGGRGAAADPQAKLMELASGSHTLRVAADGPEKQRISIIGDAAEYSVIHNGNEVWAYDSADKSAYHATAPEGVGGEDGKGAKGGEAAKPDRGPADATPQEFAKRALEAVDPTTSVTVDGTGKVAGRDAYQLLIKPKQAESTVGSVRIAVDAANGMPLKVTLSPKSGGKPVFDAGFTSVDFAKPDPKTFEFTPPKGAEVTEQKDPDPLDRKAGDGGVDIPVDRAADGFDLEKLAELARLDGLGEGWATVVRLKGPDGSDGSGMPSDKNGGLPPEAQQFVDSLGDKVTGKFGSGTVFSTRLINALVTDDGAVYVGAVDKSALVKAANEAK
jgi:outer membrane lipoprotein-sorting protein